MAEMILEWLICCGGGDNVEGWKRGETTSVGIAGSVCSDLLMKCGGESGVAGIELIENL